MRCTIGRFVAAEFVEGEFMTKPAWLTKTTLIVFALISLSGGLIVAG
jgi:hypothetical protein